VQLSEDGSTRVQLLQLSEVAKMRRDGAIEPIRIEPPEKAEMNERPGFGIEFKSRSIIKDDKYYCQEER